MGSAKCYLPTAYVPDDSVHCRCALLLYDAECAGARRRPAAHLASPLGQGSRLPPLDWRSGPEGQGRRRHARCDHRHSHGRDDRASGTRRAAGERTTRPRRRDAHERRVAPRRAAGDQGARRRGPPCDCRARDVSVPGQPALDALEPGAESEEEFLAASHWYDAWGYHWGYYREIFLYAREHRLPVRRRQCAARRRHGRPAEGPREPVRPISRRTSRRDRRQQRRSHDVLQGVVRRRRCDARRHDRRRVDGHALRAGDLGRRRWRGTR